MRKEKKIRVTVLTVPNGFSLTVNGEGYMYYDVDSLLGGIVKHVAMHSKESTDPDRLRNLINAMETWPDATQATIDAVELKAHATSLQARNEHLNLKVHSYERTIIRQAERIKSLEKELKCLKKINAR